MRNSQKQYIDKMTHRCWFFYPVILWSSQRLCSPFVRAGLILLQPPPPVCWVLVAWSQTACSCARVTGDRSLLQDASGHECAPIDFQHLFVLFLASSCNNGTAVIIYCTVLYSGIPLPMSFLASIL